MRKALLLLALIACGGDDKKTPDAAPPAIDAAPPVPLTCDQYCTQVMANCTGTNAQYTDPRHCMGSCATFPVGTSKVTDTSGNTLGCRIYHSGDPAKADPALHCPHTGPAGDKITVATPAFCSGGDLCTTFCAEEIATCGSLDQPKTVGGTAITAQYKNQAACEAVCRNGDNTVTPAVPAFDKTHNYATNATGNSLACRFNHWTNAAALSIVDPANPANAVNPGGVTTHCGHTAPTATAQCVGAASPP